MNGPLLQPKFFGRYAAFLLYTVLLAFFLHLSWMRWGDLIVDSGKEWSVPEQILKGKVLYRDLAWLYGPLIPYLNALFLLIGGVKLGSLVASGLLSLLLTLVALHLLAREVLGEWLAVLTVTTFLSVLAFGFYIAPHNYNYILPYTYAATYAMAFALGSLVGFVRRLKGPDGGRMMAGFLTAAFLTRWEIGAALGAAMVAGTWLWKKADPEKGREGFRVVLGSVLWAGSLTALITVFFLGLVARESGAMEAILTHLSPTSPFALGLTGLDRWGENLLGLAVTSGLYAVFTLIFAAAGQGVRAFERDGTGPKVRILTGMIALFALMLVYFLYKNLFGAPAQFRCLPFIALAWGWMTARDLRARREPADILRLVLSLFSFLVLLRIVLKAWPGQYGFTLLVPGLVVYYGFFLQSLPSWFGEARVRTFVRGGFLAVSLLFLADNVIVERGWYMKSTFPVGTARGELLFFPAEPAPSCQKLLEYLRMEASAGDTMAVFPEGAALNFLSGLPNPLADYVCNPVDLAAAGTTKRVIDQMEREKPVFVLLLQRDTSEYGRAAFGVDYGKDIMGYVFSHYLSIQQFGPFPYTTPYFGMTLLKRHSDVVIER